jgi:hypothetical protein
LTIIFNSSKMKPARKLFLRAVLFKPKRTP